MKSSKRSLNSTPIDLMAKQGHEYTKDYREFVLTLHLHGPKACKYLRETKHVPLPHPHTLLRWLRSVDAKPTSNKMMVDMLERRCQKTQRVLLSHALEEFHARGIWVACVTVDGHASNVSMCNQLGCELKADPREPLQTSFSHPVTGEKVFVMMAACHMLKLARNMLQLRLDMMIPFLKTWMLTNYLSALVAVYHFHSVINIDTLMLMIPELLQVQRYVLTYRFSQDHLELLFNSIRASGGWNNHPSARQFQAIFHRLMVRFGVSPGKTGHVAAQDNTESLSAVEMFSPETAEEHPSPFANISGLVCDHSYLPTRFGGLVENALVYIAGVVVREEIGTEDVFSAWGTH